MGRTEPWNLTYMAIGNEVHDPSLVSSQKAEFECRAPFTGVLSMH